MTQSNLNPIDSYFANCYKQGAMLDMPAVPGKVNSFGKNIKSMSRDKLMTLFYAAPDETYDFILPELPEIRDNEIIPNDAIFVLAENLYTQLFTNQYQTQYDANYSVYAEPTGDSYRVVYAPEIQVWDSSGNYQFSYTLYYRILTLKGNSLNNQMLSGNSDLYSNETLKTFMMPLMPLNRSQYLNPIKDWIQRVRKDMVTYINKD